MVNTYVLQTTRRVLPYSTYNPRCCWTELLNISQEISSILFKGRKCILQTILSQWTETKKAYYTKANHAWHQSIGNMCTDRGGTFIEYSGSVLYDIARISLPKFQKEVVPLPKHFCRQRGFHGKGFHQKSLGNVLSLKSPRRLCSSQDMCGGYPSSHYDVFFFML